MADLADHAYGHALAVLGDPAAALVAAERGLLRGGRSRVAVLGHSRAAVLAAADEGATVDTAVPTTISEAALSLARRRPAVERVVVDLESRHGLTRTGFARALGVGPADAAERVASVAAAWSAELDPALFRWLGPGDCDELAAVLGDGDAGGVDADRMLADAPVVSAHAEGCALCGDRLRAMVSVRTLLSQLPLPAAPQELASASRAARRRPPVSPPVLGDDRSRVWVRAVEVVVVAAAAALVVVAGAAVLPSGDGGRDDRVEALTQKPTAGGSLSVSSETLHSPLTLVKLANSSGRTVKWQSSATVPYLAAEPARGTLGPGESVDVRIEFGRGAPEGDVSGVISFAAADGSTVSVAGSLTIEHAPDIAAHRNGCEIVASVEDEGRVAGAVLHWRTSEGGGGAAGATAQSDPMVAAKDGEFRGGLPPNAVLWWVTATDARGNTGHGAESAITPPAC